MKAISEENLSNMLLACLITLLFLAGIFHTKKTNSPVLEPTIKYSTQ